MLVALHCQLVYHQPVVGGRVVKPHHLEADAHLPGPVHTGDGQSRGHPAVKLTVGRQQSWHVGVGQSQHCRFNGGRWRIGVEACQCPVKTTREHHLTEILPLRNVTVRSELWTMGDGVSHLLEPRQGLLLQVVFRD